MNLLHRNIISELAAVGNDIHTFMLEPVRGVVAAKMQAVALEFAHSNE